MAIKLSTGTQLFNANLVAAGRGSGKAYFELGMAYSTGTDGADINLVEAHKWFNLAALGGVREGSLLRTEIASDMDREDIAEAQRQARAWLTALGSPPAALRNVA